MSGYTASLQLTGSSEIRSHKRSSLQWPHNVALVGTPGEPTATEVDAFLRILAGIVQRVASVQEEASAA